MDGQGVPPLNGDGDGAADAVSEGVVRGEGEVVLACEAELIDELLRVFTDPSCGLHCEGDEVSVLSRRYLLVLEMLVPCCALGYCKASGPGKGQIRRGEWVRADDIGEDGCTGEYDVEVRSASILGTESIGLLAAGRS